MTAFADNYERDDRLEGEAAAVRRFWQRVEADRARDPWAGASVRQVADAALRVGVSAPGPTLRRLLREQERDAGLPPGSLLVEGAP